MRNRRPGTVQKLCLTLAGLALCALPAGAQKVLERGSNLHALAQESSRLTMSAEMVALDESRSIVSPEADLDLVEFESRHGKRWTAHVDPRTGQIGTLEGSGVAFFPGRGNSLKKSDVASYLGGKSTPDLAAHDRRARAFLPEIARMFGIQPNELRLNHGRSGSPAPHVWFVDYDVTVDGVAVEGARLVLAVNNGNLVSIGSENLPAAGSKTPKKQVDEAKARKIVDDYIGGFRADDSFRNRGSYHLMPGNIVDLGFNEGYQPGRGRDLVGVWEIVFHRSGDVGTFRARVDADSGELLEFVDVNEYGAASGGTYQSDRPATERVLPLPYANVATGVFTNSAGIFSGTTGTTTLDGQYVKITDSCGAISKAADASGNLALGSSTGTDCTTPGSGGAGNTHAARTQFYALNRAKEVARGWLPSNSWINAKLTANVNLNQTCNAYWNGSTVNFFRSGGGCVNTGELPGISLHEYGHGLDTNDGGGSSPDNGTGETYGDFTAALATHSSCVGNGFLTSNCGGYGNSCTSCTGVRDIDWAKHTRNAASTVENFTRPTCPQPSANNPNYVGACGKDAIARNTLTKKREGHCESYVSSEALWDLAARDMPSPGSGAAWTIVDRLWYLSRSTASAAFSCNVSATAWTSDGCNTGSLFKIFRTVDDDNGNLADGTPHGGAIAAAMNRHGIACTTDTAWNTTFAAVTPPAVPALNVTAGNNTANLSWSGSSGVYDVYRNETGCSAGFTKARNDNTTTSYADTAVANGLTYFYQVVAHASGNEAASSAPSSCVSVTPTAGTCTPPAAPTALSATATSSSQINLSWTAASGATSYTISRATVSGGPYSSVGTSATTSFSNTGLTASTTYFYVVSASNGSCSSGNSAQASATTQAGSGNVLSNGVPVTGISGATGNQQFWTMSMPAGATNLQFTTSGGTGDVDLYVRFGSAPTTTTADCKSEGTATTETCTFATPSVGTYHVLLYGYATYSGVTLTGSYASACTPPAAPTGLIATAISSSQINLSWTASSGATSYTISRATVSGGPYSSVGTSATTSFSNTGLAASTTYYYVVTASNGSCGSGNSTQASATTQAGGGGSELLVNPGFESATTQWVISGSAARSTGSYPHSGVAYAYLANVNNASGTIYQQIAIPSAATGTMTFWLNTTSAETTTVTQYDKLFIEVRNTSGTLLTTLATYSNLNKTTAGSYSQKTLNVAAYKGQTVRIQFRATSDASLITTFRIDDVSVK